VTTRRGAIVARLPALLAVVLVLAFGVGSASAQPTLISPANGATFPRNVPSIVFTIDVPASAAYATIQFSSSPAANADGSLANPDGFSGIVLNPYMALGSAATFTWQSPNLAAGTVYWNAISCTTTVYVCNSEGAPVQSIVLTPLPPPAPVSPANGATQTVMASTEFVFTVNSQPEDTSAVVVFSRSNTVGADGVLAQPTSTTGDLTADIGANNTVSVPIPAALDVPGAIYWQPVRVNCSDNPTPPCDVAGPVTMLTLKKKPPPPPPPLHIQVGGATTVRIGKPNIAWTVSCSEACDASVSVRATVQSGQRAVHDGQFDLAPANVSIGTGQEHSFHHTYAGNTLAQLKHAVSLHGDVKLDVIVSASSKTGGGTAHASRNLFMRQNPAPPPPPPPPPPKPKPLDVHDFNGNALAVTVSVFADPATPANQFLQPPGGDRLVAIHETLTDLGPGIVTSDVDSDTTLVGSDGQVYTASFDPVQGCTNFNYGAFTLFTGESESGCVTFAVPDGVSISRIAFTLTDGFVDTAQWIATG
jgi:hypothetical protein